MKYLIIAIVAAFAGFYAGSIFTKKLLEPLTERGVELADYSTINNLISEVPASFISKEVQKSGMQGGTFVGFSFILNDFQGENLLNNGFERKEQSEDARAPIVGAFASVYGMLDNHYYEKIMPEGAIALIVVKWEDNKSIVFLSCDSKVWNFNKAKSDGNNGES